MLVLSKAIHSARVLRNFESAYTHIQINILALLVLYLSHKCCLCRGEELVCGAACKVDAAHSAAS